MTLKAQTPRWWEPAEPTPAILLSAAVTLSVVLLAYLGILLWRLTELPVLCMLVPAGFIYLVLRLIDHAMPEVDSPERGL